MLLLHELLNYLNTLYNSSSISDYCPNGLQIEGKKQIQKVATAVSANLETIETAIANRVDALIVHHGIFWNRDSYIIEGSKRKKILELLCNDISLLAYHLPMDLHPEIGNNWKAAVDMGWTCLQPFGFYNGSFIGVKGRMDPITPSELQKELESYYQHPAVCAFGGKEMIESIALISGGSHKCLADAAKEGIDAFVTGSFDEPSWSQAYEENIHFFAMGHSASERVGPQALAEHLAAKFEMPCQFIDIKNPF